MMFEVGPESAPDPSKLAVSTDLPSFTSSTSL